MKTRTANFFEVSLTGLLVGITATPPSLLYGAPATNPPPIVVRHIINDGAPQRSTVTNLALVFSTNVTVTPSNLVLRNLTTTNVVDSTNIALVYDAISNKATFTFPGLPADSLPDGNYVASVLANTVISAAGQRLDGNSDGREGDAYTFDLFRYFGDWNGDRDVDFWDNYWFQRAYGKATPHLDYDPRFDLNGDGIVSSADLPAFEAHYFTVLPRQPAIFAALVNDTGLSPWDHVTTDATISGTVIRTNFTARFEARLSSAAFVDVTSTLTTNGSFNFSSNLLSEILGAPLGSGPYELELRTIENSGVISATFLLPFTLEAELACPFTNGWPITVAQASPISPESVSGGVAFTNCELLLTEGDSFVVTAERRVTIVTNASLLCVTYAVPGFDTSAANLMRDAFEAALVDIAGRPLTFTIQGSNGVLSASASAPPALPPSPDALFNHTDGHAPFVAPGTALTSEMANPQSRTVAVDVSHLPPGSIARLILRLVNNDRDRATTVRITDVRFKPFDPALNFGDSSLTALSLLGSGNLIPRSSTALTNPFCPPGASGPRAGLSASVATFPTNIFGGGLIGPETPAGDSVLSPHGRLTFTTTAEFGRGTLVDLNATNVAAELRLNANFIGFPFIWIPNQNETVSKVDTRTGRELARYRTGPDGFDGEPSRTTVDAKGSCWLGNRYAGSVIKVGLLEAGECIDRNTSGVIDTSRDLNGDGLITGAELLPWGQDECVLWEIIVIPGREGTFVPGAYSGGYNHDFSQPGPRSLAVDAQNNLWLGCLGSQRFYYIDGSTGRILKNISVAPWNHSAYGAVIDQRGILWSSGQERNHILRLDPSTDPPTISTLSLGHFSYGIGLDYSNHLFVSGWENQYLTKINVSVNPPVILWSRQYAELPRARGIVVTQGDNDVWVVSSINNRVYRYDNDGVLKTSIGGFSQPTGVAIDSSNKVWVAGLDSENIFRIDPARNVVDLTKELTGSGGHYTYSDMTGQVLANTIRRGSWSEIVDSGRAATVWGAVALTANTPPGTSVRLRVRASDLRNSLATLPEIVSLPGQPLPDVRGQFLEVRVTLDTDLNDATPSVQDITVLAVPPPSLITDAPGTVFAPGATILISGQAVAGEPGLPGGSIVRNAITTLSLNGMPPDALDAAGNYFSAVEIRPGLNTFVVAATDLFGQSTTNILTIQGACPDNFSSLGEVSASVQPEYGRTSFNEWTKTLYADLAIRNAGTYPIHAPFYVGITHISDPTVRLLAPDGVSVDGIPYYDFSATITNATLDLQQSTLSRTLAFQNPSKVQFGYDLVILGQLNQAPHFTTSPSLEVATSRIYTYDSEAVDLDGDRLVYSLIESAPGMTINTDTGLISWTAASQIGTYSVRLRADDRRGGLAEQSYLLSVIIPPSNCPPFFVSTPVVVARVFTGDPSSQGGSIFLTGHDPDAHVIEGFQNVEGAKHIIQAGIRFVTDTNFNPFARPGQQKFIFVDTKEVIPVSFPSFHAVDALIQSGYVPGIDFDHHDYSTLDSALDALGTTYRAVVVGSQYGNLVQKAEVEILNRRSANIVAFLDGGGGLFAMTEADTVAAFTPAGGYFGFLPFVVSSVSAQQSESGNVLTAVGQQLGLTVSDINGNFSHNVFLETSGLNVVDFDPQGRILSLAGRGRVFGSGVVRPGEYAYDADAIDPDGDALRYSIPIAPVGMTISTNTGLVRWAPTADQIGTHNVAVLVQDARGGSNTQSYIICVLPAEGNRPPIIVSCPATNVILNGMTLTPQTNVVLPYLSSDYRYREVAWDGEPGFERPGYDDSAFSTGQAGFGSQNSFCALNDPQFARTPWNINTDLLLRRHLILPEGVTGLQIGIAIDNDARIYVNGTEVTTGWLIGPGCPSQDNFVINVSPTILRGGTNLLAVRAHDFGVVCYVDVRATATFVPTTSQSYSYPIAALDPDNDTLAYSLVAGPIGLSVNPTNGLVTWSPTANQLGENPVVIRVSDGRGGFDDQNFQLNVVAFGTGEISGAVLNAEPATGAVSDHTVYLDLNGDGRRDVGEPSQQVDNRGDYRFSNLPAGTYVVALDPASGWIQTLPLAPLGSLLVNEGFEDVPVEFNSQGFQTLSAGATNIPGWEISRGTVDLVGNSFFYAAHGGVSVDLAGNSAGSIAQELRTEPGRRYQVQFNMAGNPIDIGGLGGPALKHMRLHAGSQSINLAFDVTGRTRTDMGWTNIVWEFGAESDLTKVEFEGLAESWGGIAIDDISILPAATSAVYVVNLSANESVMNIHFTVRRPTEDRVAVSEFVTTPLFVAVATEHYVYSSRASGFSSSPLTWDLVAHPEGMLVEEDTGVVAWRALLSQLGVHDVILRVHDGRGGVALQSWQITVIAPNAPPFITTFPPGPAVVGFPYRYQIRAQDAEEQPLSLALGTNTPAGLMVDAQFATPKSAVIAWTPALAQLGTNRVEIIVRDIGGAEATQAFDLLVVASAPNNPPVFTSVPRLQTRLDLPYGYNAEVTDADGDPVALQLVLGPAGMVLTNAQPSAFNSGLLIWNPTAGQVGMNPVTLRATDGRGGMVEQSFIVNVTSTLSNEPPQIVSSPPLHATAGQLYQYDLEATDPDNDPVSWRLVAGPVGISLDANSGALRWTPTLDQLGTNTVTVEAQDTLLATDTQTWQIDVGCVNRPPEITSVPPTQAQTGDPYLYAPRATDPDGDAIKWSVRVTPPALGLTNDPVTGLIRWTPGTNQVGSYLVHLVANDQRGGTNAQDYVLYVADLRANKSPIIVSTPQRGATVGRPYTYTLLATDADGDTLTLQSLLPLPAGSAFTSSPGGEGRGEGVLSWTPTAAQLGSQEFILTARDPAGASASQRFFVTVRTNEPPTIVSTPRTNAVPGSTYRYDVHAIDPDGDALTFALVPPVPPGMTIDALGRIAWSVLPAHVGSYNVTVAASDPFGATATQTFPLTVSADTEPPVVALLIGYNLQDESGNRYVRAGTQAGLRVTASDNVAVASRGLLLDGTPLALASDGSGVASFPNAGFVQAIAEASDFAGNVARVTNTIPVVDPNASNTVVITFHSPTNSAEITRPVAVVATITSQAPLRDYSLEVAEVTAEASGVEIPVDDPSLHYQTITNVTLPPGTGGLTNAVLGRFDPTILQNGGYVLRVTAYDINGKGDQTGVVVNVTGNLKFGEFRLEFTDLAIPVAGIPITVKRVYDSRDAGRKRDFGYGWSLALQDARILEAAKRPYGGLDGGDSTFTARTRVYLTTPDGRRVGFNFTPQVDAVALFLGAFYRPGFTGDPGVYDKLEAIPTEGGYQITPDGSFVGGFGLVGFDPSGYRLTTRDNLVYEYDQNFGLRTVTDLNGNNLSFATDGITHRMAGSGAIDQQITFVRDAMGRITEIIDPNGKSLRYTYDGAGDLRSFSDQVTNTTRYFYDASRAHFLTNIIDPLGHPALRMEYDEAGRLVTVRDANGSPISQDFDADSNTGTFTDGNGNVTVVKFDDRGNEVVRMLEGVFTNYFAYDANNNLLASTNGRGFATNYTYDARGNVTSITDSLGNRTTVAYNEQNKPVGVTNALGQKLVLAYNASGQLTQVVNNAGLKTLVTRDIQGRVTSLTDATGTNTTIFDYSNGCACGRPGKVINPDGSFRLYDYNSLGQTNFVVNELDAKTVFEHDRSGRLLSVSDPLTNITHFYYKGPLLTNVVDALGRHTRYEYDDLNHTNKIIDAEGGIVEFRYDNNGNRTHVIDPVTNVTTFIFDAANRLKMQIDPLGHTNFFAYDAAGNRTEAIDRNGRRRTFAYDALNRMTNELWWEGTRITNSIVFGFNELGVQTHASDTNATYQYSYDVLNRLKQVKQSAVPGQPDFTLDYSYTSLGQIESVTDNSGVRVGSSYDIRNRLSSRTCQGPGIDAARVDFAYDVTGNRTRTDRFGDLAGTNRIGHTTNAYNRVGIVTNITHVGPASEVLARYDYNFDAAYQIRQWTINNQPSVFDYDQTGQLTNALNTAKPNENFGFDANGNRAGAQSSGSYVVGQNNQILSDGTNSYAYDAEGNMTSRSNTVTRVLTTYQFDHRNRLVSVLDRNPGGVVTQTVAFVYDGMNRRLSKTVNGQVTRFLYNQDDPWADLDGTNAVIARYLHGARIDELLGRQRASEGRGWYLTDHLGTVRNIVNAQGAAVAHVDYSTFGQVMNVSNPAAVDRFLFTGREFDAETGFYFYRARYYSAQFGRFISQDPIGFASGDYNLYRYAANSPVHKYDPTGALSLISYAILASVAVGALIGGYCYYLTGDATSSVQTGVAFAVSSVAIATALIEISVALTVSAGAARALVGGGGGIFFLPLVCLGTTK